MPTIRTIPQYVNADDDYRHIDSNAAAWMKNVRTWRSLTNENKTIEKVTGNSEITWTPPSGTNVIGTDCTSR